MQAAGHKQSNVSDTPRDDEKTTHLVVEGFDNVESLKEKDKDHGVRRVPRVSVSHLLACGADVTQNPEDQSRPQLVKVTKV